MPTSIIGGLGVGRQSAMNSAATIMQYMPVTTIGLNPNQNVQALPAEVGGAYFLRGSFKASEAGGGDTGMVIRPNSFLYILFALCGVDNASIITGTNGNAGQHILTPFVPAVGADLPWMTLIKDSAKLYAEQYLNSKLQSLQLSIAKQSIASASTTWLATTPSEIALPGTETMDTSPSFQTALATLSLTQEGGSSIIGVNTIENLNLSFTNNLSNDEYGVGSLFLTGITLLQRLCTVDIDVIVRDTNLYNAVYYNGGSSPQSLSPTLYRGSLTVTLTSSSYIPNSNNTPYSLQIVFPGLDFMAMPISIQGAQLVRATLSSQVTLGPSGTDTYNFTLINGITGSY
jgi:hypothetical protein